MKKLHSFAFYALVTPAITLAAGSVLAEKYSGQNMDGEKKSTQRDQDAKQSTPLSRQSDQGTQSAGQSDSQAAAENAKRGQEAKQSAPLSRQSDQGTKRVGQSDSHPALDHRNTSNQSRMQNRGYLDSAPDNGMQSSNLIGAEVKTSADEQVGSVSDLIIDENGQIVAIVIGVGGFLGMGERDVAIGWDDVSRSDTSDELELRIDATREDLSTAPEYKAQD